MRQMNGCTPQSVSIWSISAASLVVLRIGQRCTNRLTSEFFRLSNNSAFFLLLAKASDPNRHLKPGGYIEQIEISIDFKSDDGTIPPESSLSRLTNVRLPCLHATVVTVIEYSIETLKRAKSLWLSIDFQIALNRSWTNYRTNVQNCRYDEGIYRRSRIRECRRESIQNSHRRLARRSQATRIRAVGVIRLRYRP
jgi:hypothetical protein